MAEDRIVAFTCNICSGDNEVVLSSLIREAPTCSHCGSNIRFRSIAHILTTELLGSCSNLGDLPVRKDILGIGMSCWDGYASRLAEKFAFTNTFYHCEPRLDITDISAWQPGSLDFITSSDVFEHIAPPVSRAFTNARRLLKKGGVLVFSVPYNRAGKWWARTIEHFPNLHQYDIVEEEGRKVLRNTTFKGKTETFEDLVFHGGEGATLEMRLFSERSIVREMKRAGFNQLTIYRSPHWGCGMYWRNDRSITMAAKYTGENDGFRMTFK